MAQITGIIETFGSGSKDFKEENSGYYNLVRKCTDKVKVRNYVRERIGKKYLKPALQIIGNCSPSTSGRGRGEGIPLAENDISTYFEQINFEELPNAFVIKCNHGCKWHYIIKNKDLFLQNKRLIEIVRKQITGWLEQDYSIWGGFEMQYKAKLCTNKVRLAKNEMNACDSNVNDSGSEFQEGIESKILIEPLMRKEINIYFFNGMPKIIIKFFDGNKMSIWNENFESIENIYNFSEENIKCKSDVLIKHTFVLSKQLVKNTNFKLVRVDWMIYKITIMVGKEYAVRIALIMYLEDVGTEQLALGNFILVSKLSNFATQKKSIVFISFLYDIILKLLK